MWELQPHRVGKYFQSPHFSIWFVFGLFPVTLDHRAVPPREGGSDLEPEQGLILEAKP